MLNLGMRKVVITGGHLTPALGVIEEIKKDKDDWEVFYFGRKYALESNKNESFEYRTLKNDQKINFVPINTGRLQRKISLESIKSLIKIPIGLIKSFSKLSKIKPEIIISFGGYLSVPVVISGWFLNIPSITHEQTRTVGLGTKINKYFVKKIAVSFPEVIEKLPRNKTVLTGNPVESGVFNYQPPKDKYPFSAVLKSNKPILFVTGGKTGSKIINQTIIKIKDKLSKDFFICHQIGLDFDLDEKREENYLSLRFLTNQEFGWLLRQTVLVISRSGANICTYLAEIGRKAILIPIPWSSENEQEKNALWMENIGLGKKIDQKKLSPKKLFEEVISLLESGKDFNLPDWWQEANPKKAGEKVWLLAKETTTK